MQKKDFKEAVKILSKIGDVSLNGDPMSFKGKIVIPLDDDKIAKIFCAYDAVADIFILQKAKEEGITFFTPFEIFEAGPLTILVQDKLRICEKDKFKREEFRFPSVNKWCNTSTDEELLISELIVTDYGQEGFQKIKEFNEKYYIGNIYWRNIGFDKRGFIQCFDFFCGKLRDEKGEPICINLPK